MSREPVFNPREARGILRVFAVVGQSLGPEPVAGEQEDLMEKASEEVPEEVPEEPQEPPSESSEHQAPEAPRPSDSVPFLQDALQPRGDRAALRLLDLAEQAKQGRVAEPPPSEPVTTEPRAVEPLTAKALPDVKPAPLPPPVDRPPVSSATPKGQRDAVPTEAAWRRNVIEPEVEAEQAPSPTAWLEALLSDAGQEPG